MRSAFLHILKKNLKNKRPMKLQTKLFLAYMLTSELVLIFFTIFFYQYSSPILIDKEISAVRTINTTFKEQVDDVLNDLDITSANINYSSLVSNQFEPFFNLEIDQSRLPELASLFVAINGTDIKADQINLFDFHGNVVRVGMVTNTKKVNTDSLKWFDPVLELDGFKLIGEPYYTAAYSTSSNYPDWFLSLYRTYSDSYGRKVGAVETIKRCKSIFKPIISYQKKNETTLKTYVFNSDGALVYPYELSAQDNLQLSNYYQYSNTFSDNCYIVNSYTNQKEHLVFEKSAYSGWTYISVQPENIILQPVNNLLSLLLPVASGIFILAIVISYYLSQNMVKPVIHLKGMIQRLELHTLGKDNHPDFGTSYDELNEVYQAFQYMSGKLKTSMDELIDTRQQELKSRTLALQSQINPHFYYNTLSSIIILSENGQQEEVIHLCRSLTQIMRYITDGNASLVTLGEELDYVEKYLYCMKVRYQSSLDFAIDVPKELLKLQIPKLIIQPLVENALKHGTDCLPPWHIEINGKVYPDYWEIRVSDSGNGFSDEVLNKIKGRIEYITKNPGLPELKLDGMGLLNVYMRWKIHARDQFILEFTNTAEGHGCVIIGMKKVPQNND